MSDYMYTAEQHADNLIVLLMEMGINDEVRAQHPALDLARFDLVQSTGPQVRALGYALGLTALLNTPDALRMAAEELRSRLSQGVPIVW